MAEDHARQQSFSPTCLRLPHQKQLAELTLRNGLPAIFGFREFVDMGGLISLWFDSPWDWRRAALYADKILKGADPGALPIDQPSASNWS